MSKCEFMEKECPNKFDTKAECCLNCLAEELTKRIMMELKNDD